MIRYRLSARDRQSGRFREVVIVEAETGLDALAAIRASAHHAVLAFAHHDVRLEPVEDTAAPRDA